MTTLADFRAGLEPYLVHLGARPFVCAGSPLACRSFVVGLNAATALDHHFSAYWSDETGFDRELFLNHYRRLRKRAGNRPVVEAISRTLGSCIETNLYAVPTRKARELTLADRERPVIEYLFRSIKPRAVFVHSNEPIEYFARQTGCGDFVSQPRQVTWHGHAFWILGRRGPLYTLGLKGGAKYVAELADLANSS